MTSAGPTPDHLRTWRDYLSGATIGLELPAEAPAARDRLAGEASGRLPVTLSAPATAALARLSAQAAQPEQTVWLAAFAALLGRYSGEDELVIALPSDDGASAVRIDFSGEPTLAQLTRRVAAAVAQVSERLRPDDLATLLQAAQPATPRTELAPFTAGFVCGPPARAVDRSLVELTLAVAGRDAELIYNPKLFTEAGIERITSHLLTLLEHTGTAVEGPVGRVGVIPAAERRQLLVDWNATSMPFDESRDFPACLAELATSAPDSLAVTDRSGALTFSELNAQVNQLVAELQAAGVAREDPVGLMIGRSVANVTALTAILRAGAAAVLIDPDNPDDRIAFMLSDSGARIVVTTAALTDRLIDNQDRVVIHADQPETWVAPHRAGRPEVSISPDQISHVIYTSGSTGLPKAVLERHRAIANLISWTGAAYQLTPADRATWLSAPGFAIGLMEWIPFLANGVPIYIADAQTAKNPSLLRDWLIENRITHTLLVTSLAERLYVQAWPGDAALRLMVVAGERSLRWPPADLPFEVAICYGSTEATNVTCCFDARTGLRVTSATATPAARLRPPPVGRPIANVRLYILDKHLEPLPLGAVGDLYVAGAGVCAGYLDRPDLTSAQFVPHPLPEEPEPVLYRTGDLARYRPDGLVDIVGRADGQVKIRGFRVELGEVEAALIDQDGITEAAAVIRDDQSAGTRLAAYLVTKPTAGLSVAGLRKAVAERLPLYMIPADFILIDELPKLRNGKVDRQSLARIAGPRLRSGAEHVDPATPTQRLIAELWTETLGAERPGINDDFFQAGGHSLLAVDLAARVEAVSGQRLGLADLHEHPTIGGIAALIDSGLPPSPGLNQIIHDPEQRHQPFPLTDTQHAYLVGRGNDFELGNMGCHGYFEWDSDDLDIERFAKAWRRLVDRHDVLRTMIREDGTQQVLDEPGEYEILVSDLRGAEPPATQARLAAIREQLAREVLPVDRWPLFDVRISLLSDGKVRLHLRFDLLIADAWSYYRVLMPDLLAYYTNPAAELEPLEITFRDYVLAAKAANQDSDQYRQSRQYWLGRLDLLPGPPDLPAATADPVRPEVTRFHRHAHVLLTSDWSALKRLAGDHFISPTCLLVAAFAEVIRTWSVTEQFTLNLPLFNRLALHPQVNELAGDFTTTLLLAVEKTDGTFAQRAKAIQRQLWSDLEHRRFDGIEVVRELTRRHRSGLRPIFPVVVTSLLGLPPHRTDDLGQPGYEITQSPQVTFDFQIYEVDGALEFNWDCLDGQFAPGVIDDMFTAYCGLLELLAAGEDAMAQRRFSLVPRTQLAERDEVNDTRTPVSATLLHEPVARHAARAPESLAVVAPDRRLTYAELNREMNQVGWSLREAGAHPNGLVAVIMDKGWRQVVGVLGVLASGAAFLPIDAAASSDRIRQVLRHGQVSIVLTQTAVADRIELSDVATVLCVDRDSVPANSSAPPVTQQATDLAYVINTSGSTGEPKGVMVDHQGAWNTITEVNEIFSIGPEDSLLAVSALHFDMTIYDFFGMIAAGGTIVFPAPTEVADPDQWASLVAREGVTTWNSVPQLLELLVTWVESSRADNPLSSLRVAMLSGDWIPLSLPGRVRALVPDIRIFSGGGATETCVWGIIRAIGDVDPTWTSIPYGRPMANRRCQVVDAQGFPRPVWVPGEIHFSGWVGLALGYLNDRRATCAQFYRLETGEPGYATGDVGRYLPGGEIELLGRMDSQVKILGNRVELGAIEAALVSHPAIRTCAVIALGASRAKDTLRGFVVPADNHVVDGDELRRYLSDRLPPYMVPAQLTAVDALPLNPNGKVDRRALADLPPDRATRTTETPADAASPLEVVMCAIWADQLSLDLVSADDDFFELGGNSIVATRIISRVQELLSAKLSITEVFSNPTVVQVCAAIERTDGDAPGTLAARLCELTDAGVDELLGDS